MGLNPRGLEFLVALDLPLGDVATLGRQEAHNLDAETTERLTGVPGPIGTFAEPILGRIGAGSVTSIDASDYEGATIVADMNVPLDEDLRQRFDTVIDGGTLEHVFNIGVGVANAMEMVRQGGWLVHITPTNQAAGHGFYQLSPELFFRALSPTNGYQIRCVLVREETLKGVWRWVRDPDEVGHRIQFRTAGEAYLYVAAQRVEARSVMESWPQQSDYESEWAREGRQQWTVSVPKWRRVASRLVPEVIHSRLRSLSIRTSPEDLPVIGPHLTKEILTERVPWPAP
jgi:hypothetical protein